MPESWTGRQALGIDGAFLGVVEEVYLDRASGRPAFVLISNGSAPGEGTQSTIVPLDGASEREGAIVLGFPSAQIAGAPVAKRDDVLTPDREDEIYAYYGLTRLVAPDAQPTEPLSPPTDDAMTVSEEQLVVDKTPVPRERVRVRKQVVEEQVTVTVTLRREELRVEREPIADPAAVELEPGADIGEAEMSFFLLAEEPVIGKRVVPVEQVHIRKEIVDDERPVTEEVRRERVEVERDPP